jgi:hypothetical protein
MVDAEKCVGIAITLETLRMRYPYENWNVNDAIEIYTKNGVFHETQMEYRTDTLNTIWKGEFARYAQDQDIPLLVQNQSRLIWLPEGTEELSIVMNYDMVSIQERTVGDLTFAVDFGYDGSYDYEHPFLGSRLSGVKEVTLTIDPSNTGKYCAIGVYGQGFKMIRPLQDREFMELRIEYSIGASIKLGIEPDQDLLISPPVPNSMVSRWEEGEPSSDHQGGRILLEGIIYDGKLIRPIPETGSPSQDEGDPLMFLLILAVLALMGTGIYLYIKKKGGKK